MTALANGASGHAFELDDVHEEAINHPGAVVIPAALALAEDLNCSGRDLLEAIVIGYEAMGRAGIAVGPTSHMLAGFHPTSMSGVFGAAAAAGPAPAALLRPATLAGCLQGVSDFFWHILQRI